MTDPFDYSVYDPYLPRANPPPGQPDYLSESETVAIDRVARQMSQRREEEFDALPEEQQHRYQCQAEMAFCTAGIMELERSVRERHPSPPGATLTAALQVVDAFVEMLNARRGVFVFFNALQERWPADTRSWAASRLTPAPDGTGKLRGKARKETA